MKQFDEGLLPRPHARLGVIRRLPLLALVCLLGGAVLGLVACSANTEVSGAQSSGAQPLEPSIGTLALLPKTPPIKTRWFSQVSTTDPLPEYPRPQLTRSEWQSLNGQWQFGNASAGQAPPINQTLSETVLVPFPIESALSGIQRHQDRMWYKRSFTVPAAWTGRRVKLNFGAVDNQASVYVNGVQVGSHTGGFDSFSFDITPQLRSGANELIVGVFDPTNAGGQPLGKQVNVPDNGIFYTASSGIWQTVWLEPVAQAHITRLDLTPDLPGGALKVKVLGSGVSGQTVTVTASNGSSVSGNVGSELRLPVPNARLWSPTDPYLYDLTVTLKSGNTTLDTVGSYFGMRSIGLKTINGVVRPVLNGTFVFQLGTLDQGFWPDGIYTAPTDEALKYDLQTHKDLGFNMVRKHIKVEPQRWFYWADKLGLLVWQDMPSMRPNLVPNAAERAQSETELRAMIDAHRSSPAVVVWVSQNEGWGQYNQAGVADLIKAYDPSRLVNNMSGINCCGARDGGNGDLADWHVYVGPGVPNAAVSAGRARVLGEFGGLGLKVAGHEWNPARSFSYELQPDSAALSTRYLGLVAATRSLMTYQGLSAAVYTEITDVESEINGLLTYDREVMKVDAVRVRAAQQALIAASNDQPVNVNLPVNTYRSFQVTTPGFTGRFMRHQGSLGFTEVVNAGSSPTLKADATFKIVPGLADASCYSLEARNFVGQYLRHQGSRVKLAARDGSGVFDLDATWCARPGLSGVSGAVSLESLNFAGRYLRHFSAELWLSQNAGPLPSDNPAGFAQDVTWSVDAPWTP